ncbi:MAG: hypothetical protein ACK5MT_08600 [Actinomycetales bacterium]
MSRRRFAGLALTLILAATAGCSDANPSEAETSTATAASETSTATASETPTETESTADPTASVATVVPQVLVIGGIAEPFWGMDVNGSDLAYWDADVGIPFSDPANRIRFTSDRVDTESSADFTGEFKGSPFTMTITPGFCDDDMTLEPHDYSVTFAYSDYTFRGCADAA